MEYLEGETLADQLGKGALPLDQALRYAIEVADALDKAHRQGVTHRDLKPANIMLTKARAKLLDFGLAKLKPTGPQSDASTKLADALTEQGTILGTFQYMAPEQLEGRDADHRSDIWAFGCVVYEMVTGHKAFEGKSQASLIGSIMTADPRPISTLQPMSPPMLDQVIRICLAKDPDERWQGAGGIGRQLKLATDGTATQVGVALPPAVALRSSGGRPAWPFALGMSLAVGVISGLAVWVLKPLPLPADPGVMRFAITPPTTAPLLVPSISHAVAVSPDGSHIVYWSGFLGGPQLMVRAIDALSAAVLDGDIGGTAWEGPFISADSAWVGYYTAGTLKKISILGGPPVTIAATPWPRGASWGEDDTIIFGTASPGGLLRVPAGGGEPEVLTTPDAEQNEGSHGWSDILPDGRAVLFTILAASGRVETAQIALLDLDTGDQRVLIPGGSHPRYVSSGHIVYGIDGTLRAVGFDLDRLEVTTNPVPVLDGVVTRNSGAADFGLSRDGSLIYVPGADAGAAAAGLVWVDRDGTEEALPAPSRAYRTPRISPDGTRVALGVRDEEDDVWVLDLSRETLTRLTFAANADRNPVWTPDDQRVMFNSNRDGVSNLYWRAADGTGTVERLTESPNIQTPSSISPDGTGLVFEEIGPSAGRDLHTLTLDDNRQVEPLVTTAFGERNAEISPDGEWLAYQSDASGRDEVYVQPFPDVDAGRWQVSTTGGTRPLWGPDGRELFYRVGTGVVMAVTVETTPSFSAGNPGVVFEGPYVIQGPGRDYDISIDGQQFLMIKQGNQANVTVDERQIIFILNWFTELERLVPTP